MLRTAFFSLILVVSFVSSTSMLRKSVVRRQSGDAQYCHGIEGFQCQCSYYRITCTTDRELPSPLVVSQHEQHKYQTVELVITGARVVNVNEQTLAPVKELFRPDGDNFEFRVKFEGFTGLRLGASVLNQVFPANLPGSARKQLALDVYNTEVKPDNDPHLFRNLQADTLELYTIHPLKGSFQQLFDGANIKYLRLSGGDLRSEPSQSFTGNIGRLELAKQATQLSVENFPVFPAHELVINAFYVDDFNPPHAPNYENLAELHVQSLNAIPANAFRNYPNIRTLQITTDKEIDPQALNGLNKLEKLVIKETKPSLELLKNLPNLKELEANIEKLDEKTQCQLLDKLASGQLAVQATPNGRECTCVSAYLDAAAGRQPCDAQHCEHASCAAIKNNYNAAERTFNAPPRILRADGSDALRQREPQAYTGPYQISNQDQEKLQRGAAQVVPQQPVDESQRPGEGDQGRYPNQPYPQDQQEVQNQGGTQEGQPSEGTENQAGETDGDENRQGENPDGTNTDGTVVDETGSVNGTDTSTPGKRKMSWLPIIIILAALGVIALVVLIIYLVRRKKTNKGYTPTSTTEGAARQTPA